MLTDVPFHVHYLKALLVSCLLLNIPACCWTDSCGCGGDSRPADLIITELALESRILTGSDIQTIPPAMIVDFDEFALLLSAVDFDVAQAESPDLTGGFAAFACSPIPPRIAHRIELISIESRDTLYVQGSTYLPGESLNMLFSANDLTIPNAIENDAMLNSDRDGVFFQLTAPPDSLISTRFTLDITFDDAANFLLVSPYVRIE